jgi:hypothetical protein
LQQKKLHQISSFAAIFLIVTVIMTTALIANAPTQTQIARNCLIGQQNSNPTLVWERALGGKGDDRAYFAGQAGNGFLVVGSSSSFLPNQTVAWAVLVDQDGNQVWNRTFAENGGMEFRWATQTQDGFLLVGNTFFADGEVYGVAMKLDLQGDQLWNVTVCSCVGTNKLFSAVVDGTNFVAAGLAKGLNASDSSGWLIKFGPSGETIWSQAFNGSADTALRGITKTPDDCYVAVGYSDSNGEGNYDFLAAKVSADGNLVWSKTYGASESDMAYSIAAAVDGYVVAGNTYSFGSGDSDGFVFKISLNGTLMWNRDVGGLDYDSPSYIAASADGGYVVAGTTFSFGNGYRDFWLLKITDKGNVAWSCTIGRSGYEEAYAAVPAGPGCWVLAGWTNSIGSGGRYDFYVTKINVHLS